MANISDAFGTIQIYVKGKDKQESKELNKVLHNLINKVESCFCYYTALNCEPEEGEDENGVYLLDNFTGSGRWAYSTNVEETYNWIDSFLKSDAKEATDELRKDWEKINQYGWTVIFDYSDEEIGNEVLYTAVEQISHKAGEEGASLSCVQVENYDYTPENLVELDFFGDIDEAKESIGFFDNEEVIQGEE